MGWTHVPEGWAAPGTPGWPWLGSALREDHLQPGTETAVTRPRSGMPLAVLGASFPWGQDWSLVHSREMAVNAGVGGVDALQLPRSAPYWVPAATGGLFP